MAIIVVTGERQGQIWNQLTFFSQNFHQLERLGDQRTKRFAVRFRRCNDRFSEITSCVFHDHERDCIRLSDWLTNARKCITAGSRTTPPSGERPSVERDVHELMNTKSNALLIIL